MFARLRSHGLGLVLGFLAAFGSVVLVAQGVRMMSGASADLWTVDATSKAGRVSLYDTMGTLFGTSGNPVFVSGSFSERVAGHVGTYGTASFRIPGQTTATYNLATIRNNSGARAIALRRVAIDVGTSAAAVDLIVGTFRLYPNTGVTPSGGTAPTKHSFDSAFSASQAATEILFAASADGTYTAITHADPGSTPLRSNNRPAILTAVGAVPADDYLLQTYDQEPVIVRSGETCLIQLKNQTANDVATRHYYVKLIWEEFTP